VVKATVKINTSPLVGEAPIWDPIRRLVHWVDIGPGTISSTDYISLETTSFQYDEMVGAAIPRLAGGIVVAAESGFVAFDMDWNQTNRLDVLSQGFRMNDAKTDPGGCLWAGSTAIDFSAHRGGLWRLRGGWDASLQYSGITLPNGLGWSPNGSLMYLADSLQKVILKFGFDPESSSLVGEPEILVGPESFTGLPDGLAVDREGHLWVAEFGASRVTEFSAQGKRISTIEVPTAQPTSCAFVGEGLRKMWITSATSGLDLEKDSLAGSIFEVGGLISPGLEVKPFVG
jgi:sugar lactone lactonase YvrE